MASYEKDEVPMLSDAQQKSSAWNAESQFNALVSRARSASMSIPMSSLDPYESETNLVGYTGPLRSERKAPLIQMSGPIYINRRGERSTFGASGRKSMEPKVEKFSSFKGMNQDDPSEDKYDRKNDHLLRSGQLGMCNDPYCTTCPTLYKFKPAPAKHSKTSSIFDISVHNPIYGDAKGWARRFRSFLDPYIPGVMNPHATIVQKWNKCFVIFSLIAIFVDPLFFLVLSVDKEKKCIVIVSTMTKILVAFRSINDFIYLLNMLLQFRLAYVAPESTVVGAGELVDHPKKIALNYLRRYFFLDLFIVLPLPQIIVLAIFPQSLSSGANNAKNILRVAILIQYLPKLFRFLRLIVGQSPSGFIFETARANFVINLLTFVLSGHIVGSCWYLLGLQRVNQCLRDACHNSEFWNRCASFIDCGSGKNKEGIENAVLDQWRNNENATACFTEDGFPYGIYIQAVNLSTKDNFITKYVYSLFWGFQQISTLAGNQVPSYYEWEVLFTMAIIGLGLLLFALLVGNMQNFLQSLGRRGLEMTLRRRDVEQWMSHRRLPQELRRRVLAAERYNWAATRGANEEMLMENLPEDIQRDIRRHLFKFVNQVWIFAIMDEHVLDAIRERLRQKIYIGGSEIFYSGGAVEKMVFVVRGKLESIGTDGTTFLTEGNVCGEELLTWCLEHSSVNKDEKKMKMSGQRLISNRTVRCLTNVEAFSLRAIDLEEVTSIYARNLRNSRVQGAIRYESPYWRSKAARHIQVVWRYRQKRRKHTFRSNQA